MSLFKINDSAIINTDHIVFIQLRFDGRPHEVWLTDETSHEIDDVMLQILMDVAGLPQEKG